MTFLRNTWYCAAYADEVTRTPFARTILNERIALYRREDGGPVALSDTCPHRFAPMHLGRLHGDVLACPYHGLQFGDDGACRHNPHGPIIPPALRLKSYPVVDRYGVIWIWMGAPAQADETRIPDFSALVDPDRAVVKGLIPIKGGYELVTDNLLDLSHTQYLHPILMVPEDPATEKVSRVHYDGDVLITQFNDINARPTALADLMWEEPPQRLDAFAGVRWEAPANMMLEIRQVSRDARITGERAFWQGELITPETETTCHYFWYTARDFKTDDADFGALFAQVTEDVFKNEDGAMIAHLQANMGEETDLFNMRPVILPTDTAAVAARRILRKLIRAEAEEAGTPAPSSPDADLQEASSLSAIS
ncbi:MAG TPA: aromatic ring-hydroxylating dioxygenase subunit alpha [Phenylobacterium sp.]|nr:aromatic ring-hydroxylating dioxygenase subunit alpha [Phenylobacterium sp.]